MASEGKTARGVLPPSLLRQVQRHFDGGVLYIPTRLTNREVKAERDRRIWEASQRGKSAQELAELNKISVRRVYKILNIQAERMRGK